MPATNVLREWIWSLSYNDLRREAKRLGIRANRKKGVLMNLVSRATMAEAAVVLREAAALREAANNNDAERRTADTSRSNSTARDNDNVERPSSSTNRAVRQGPLQPVLNPTLQGSIAAVADSSAPECPQGNGDSAQVNPVKGATNSSAGPSEAVGNSGVSEDFHCSVAVSVDDNVESCAPGVVSVDCETQTGSVTVVVEKDCDGVRVSENIYRDDDGVTKDENSAAVDALEERGVEKTDACASANGSSSYTPQAVMANFHKRFDAKYPLGDEQRRASLIERHRQHEADVPDVFKRLSSPNPHRSVPPRPASEKRWRSFSQGPVTRTRVLCDFRNVPTTGAATAARMAPSGPIALTSTSYMASQTSVSSELKRAVKQTTEPGNGPCSSAARHDGRGTGTGDIPSRGRVRVRPSSGRRTAEQN